MIIKNVRQLYSEDFSLCSITAIKSVYSRSGQTEIFDYISEGRKRHLVHFIIDGQRFYFDGNETFSLSKGAAIFIPDQTKYKTWTNCRCTGIGICFDIKENIKLDFGIFKIESDMKSDFFHLFSSLYDEMYKNPKAVLRHKTLLYRIIDGFTRSDFSQIHIKNILTPAISFIKENFKENFPVSRYAAECCLSESYFRKQFKEFIGMSPIEYRNSLRFDEVIRLKALGMNMSEIAQNVGFCDAAYLRKSFTHQNGISLSALSELDSV